MATKKDLKRRKDWEEHIRICRMKNCATCEPHKFISKKEIIKWITKNSHPGRVGHFLKAEDLLYFLEMK